MKTKLLAGATAGIAAVIAVAAVLVLNTGSGDGGAQAAIRTQKGLPVAMAGQNLGAASGQGDTTGAAMALKSMAAADAATAGRSSLASTGGMGFNVSSSAPAPPMDAKGGYGYAPGPLQQQSAAGITVQGYGSASAAADSAVIEFYFSSTGYGVPAPYPMPDSGSAGGSEPASPVTPGAVTVITEDVLKPVIDAIKGAGVPAAGIEFIGQQYADPYSSSATLRVEAGDIASLSGVIQAATDAAAGLDGVMLNSSSVSYTVSDCAALEKAAMVAAVADAGERGAAFADALGAGLGEVIGASHYSYSPYGGGVCGQAYYGGPYPMGGMPYFEGQPSEVQVFANISVTYAIQ